MKKTLLLFALCVGAALCLSAVAFAAGPVDFNKATAEQIAKGTDGIVDADLARAIVDYRSANGPFKSPDDVRKVPGMRTLIYNSLGLKSENGSVLYSQEVEPGMNPY